MQQLTQLESLPKIRLKASPRVAIVHDYLNQFGGAERVLIALTEMFPDAPIYTLFYDPKIFDSVFPDKKIYKSFLNHRFIYKRHRLFIPLLASAAKKMDLEDNYDLIISNSASFAKGVSYKNTKHISYINAILRYAWEPEKHLKNYFPASLVKMIMPIADKLRKWDLKTGKRPDVLLANSRHTQSKIKNNYSRESEIIHPPVDTDFFKIDNNIEKQDYFLAFGRIINYKRFDITISAFNKIDKPLLIVGSGPDIDKIKKMATNKNIKFLGNVSDEELRKIINGARAAIFPQEEEFGLVVTETIASGTPAIAYNGAGFRDIIEPGVNGIFFDEQSPEALVNAIEQFENYSFDNKKVSATAEKFSKKNFQEKFMNVVDSLI